jgi:hypothetical protein
MAPEIALAQVPNIDTIKGNCPLLGIVEACKQTDEAALSRTGCPNDSHSLTSRDRQRNALEHWLMRIVPKDNVAQFDRSTYGRG